MDLQLKGRSPFYPGQPVPVELFVGRVEQIDRILKRGAGQVAEGKPISIFIQGEYGIGKSSIASFSAWLSMKECELHEIYVPLGPARTMDDLVLALIQATSRSGVFDLKRSEIIGNWLSKYIGKQDLFGFSLNFEALKKDQPNLTSPHGILDFLSEAKKRLEETGVKGIFLILDEINGIATNPDFALFIKSFVDMNALQRTSLPLLLMLVGVEERREQIIKCHEPVDRIFDVIDIKQMSDAEMVEFFDKAFQSVQMKVDRTAMEILTLNSAGFPKIMHIIGDAAFWLDKDGIINEEDAFQAVMIAAEEIGKKFVDHQVLNALRSPGYRTILNKIARMSPVQMTFQKADVLKLLTDNEKEKFNNFLRKMKELKVIKRGDVVGEYIFIVRMVRLYLWLQSKHAATPKNSAGNQ
jgi:hypothetical protein